MKRYKKKIKNVLEVAVVSMFALVACDHSDINDNPLFLLHPDSIGHWLMSDEIEAFTIQQKGTRLEDPTGFSKNDYLEVIANQVKVMQRYQNEKGGIVDPIRKKEVYYTTPCYAHSVAVLASSGYTCDSELIESGMKAMDNACNHLKNQWAPGNHGDFFTWPVLFAYRHYKEFADSTRYQEWTNSIEGIRPEKFYAYYRNFSMNWSLVHSAGEFLRFKEGFTDINYIDTCLFKQHKHFTPYGMYNEWGNPMAYDLFSRHYIAGMLALGYQGKEYEAYRKSSQKGAWMSLFMQSPFGELPTGYRSSHHIWNEAEQAMLFEIYAHQYALAGQDEIAGAYKRGAMLSLQSIKNWIRPDGSGYAVKNKYPIEARHGYENYTAHSTYNMLATSMLAQAYEFADDAIKEKLAPCDLGGYVVDIHEDFHKVFASMAGTYVEYDTKGDQLYNPTGLLRVHIKGSHPQLGPSDGCASKYSGKGVAIATGPRWKKNGKWYALASQHPVKTQIETLGKDKEKLSFKVCNTLITDEDTIFTTEIFTLSKGQVQVQTKVEGVVDSMCVSWPMLIDNGKEKTKVSMAKMQVKLRLEDKDIVFAVNSPDKVLVKRPGTRFNHRNGIVEPIYFYSSTNELNYRIANND